MTERSAPSIESWFVDEGISGLLDLPEHLRDRLEDWVSATRGEDSEGVIVSTASRIIEARGHSLPAWTGTETFYLVLGDVPTPALMRLPTILRLHKPDRRLHVTEDPGSVRRLIVAQLRAVPKEGILDAYRVAGSLVCILGDLTVRDFPVSEVPSLRGLDEEELEAFEVDPDGSFLHWPGPDLHLGASELLQAVDPMYLAEVEIDRYEAENTANALRRMREERGLLQADVEGISERHVRRLESGTARLTADSAASYAGAFGLSVSEFLEELGGRLRALAEDAPSGRLVGGVPDTKISSAGDRG